ncbi:MAG: hypothetical protein FJY85_18270, partial [Deltaproteobacteria bacterium]|nr:hypothetical protein [Deltaproteobacteria bacterium]
MRYEEKPIEREPVIQRNEGWDLRDWLSCLIRRKKTILLVGFTVFLAGAMYTALSKPVYRSIALLEIEKESGGSLSNLGDVVSQGVGAPDSEVFATQIQIIRGRTLVEALIDGMRLGEGKEEGPGIFARLTGALKTVVATIFRSLQAPDEAVSDREVLVKGVTGQISAKRDGKSRLIEVSIAAESPQKAQQMLRTHIDNFLRQNLEKRRRIQREAAEWGASEMAAAEKKVVESLTNLVAFTTQHGVVSVDESTNHVLAFFQKKAESLVKSTEQRVQVEALQKEGDARAAAVTAMKSPDADQMYAKLALMESEYAQMRELYSE